MPDPSPQIAERTFLGHPQGLAYLAFTEAWERMSFYGMQALLVLYMVGFLFLPGHAEQVIGYGPIARLVTGLTGARTVTAIASMIFGVYVALTFLAPVFGGLVGDRVLGQYRAVLVGAVSMALGHLLMTFPATFFIALALLVVGCGLLKGNISVQVARLYAPSDRRLTTGFQIYTLGIQIGVVTAPLICGTLGEVFGWHYGFGAAGIGMLVALVVYVAGRRHLPPDRLSPGGAGERPRLQAGDGRVIGALAVVLLVVTLYLVTLGQIGNAYLLWIKGHVDRSTFGFTVPVTWFLSITGFGSMILPPVVLNLWAWLARRGREPGMVTKVGIGSGLAGVACLSLSLMALLTRDGGAIAWPWLLVFHICASFGYLHLWPVGMALFARTAPAAVNATAIGAFFLSGFAANLIAGRLGGLYEVMAPSHFWLMQAAFGFTGMLLSAVFGPRLSRILLPPTADGDQREPFSP